MKDAEHTEDSPLEDYVGINFFLIGKNQCFLHELGKINKIINCNSEANVLITGETGTGKELFARAIHYMGGRSSRSDNPFVPVNCGAIPDQLIESELFGHVRGAYTGADNDQEGLVQSASKGTLFLDEIDCTPLHVQVKLSRLLEEKTYRKLGCPKTHRVSDLRIIAATNIDLENAVATGKFREDLYYRLNIIPIHIPPLRDRVDDIPPLVKHFITKYCNSYGKPEMLITPNAMSKLIQYDWPGNVRELQSTINRAVVFADTEELSVDDIMLSSCEDDIFNESFQVLKKRAIDKFERHFIESMLIAHKGNVSRASSACKKPRRAFWELMRKHGLTNTSKYKSF